MNMPSSGPYLVRGIWYQFLYVYSIVWTIINTRVACNVYTTAVVSVNPSLSLDIMPARRHGNCRRGA